MHQRIATIGEPPRRVYQSEVILKDAILTQRLRQTVHSDPHAPRYHFISPQADNICFDPNGAIFWNGRYHLFYICQDQRLVSGTEFWQRGHGWGHASSADLVHWDQHPLALTPQGGPEVGIYSGCAIVNREGLPTIVYHGCQAGTCLATPLDDDLITWKKFPGNPVIPEPQKAGDPGWGVYHVYDPFVWKEGELYYATLGGKVKPADKYDTAYLFSSRDQIDWKYLHPLYMPDTRWTDEHDDCACPKFFRLGDTHVLLCLSHARGTRYYTGDYRDRCFYPTSHQMVNHPGGCSFAPEVLMDNLGRRIAWFWVLDQRANWSEKGVVGTITLPRVLSPGTDGRIRIEPAEDLNILRQEHRRFENINLNPGGVHTLGGVSGACLELMIETAPPSRSGFTLALRASPDDAEQTTITYDPAIDELKIDVSRSSSVDKGFRPWPLDWWRPVDSQNMSSQRVALNLSASEPLKLRVFLDRSILEVFVNDYTSLVQRIYPTRSDSVGMKLTASHGPTRIACLDIWKMREINAL